MRLRTGARACRPLDGCITQYLLRHFRWKGCEEFWVDSRNRIKTTLNLVELGSSQILTIPGEALPNIGYYLKRSMSGEHNMLFGLTNDAFGYMMTRVDWGSFKRYAYITRVSLGEQTGEILIAEALKMLDRVH